jgi:transposase
LSHRNAPLTPAGRLRLIDRCQTRPIAHVAAEAGISRQCLSKWVNRHQRLGEAGLQDASSAPKDCPSRTSPQVVAEIERLRREHKFSARAITAELHRQGEQISQSTVGRWLVRLGISRLRDLDPSGASNRKPAQKIIARYPGHMIHVDVKKVGRIPDGGGWRAHGRGTDEHRASRRARHRAHARSGNKPVRTGYVFLHSAVDGYSRLAYTEHLPDEKAVTAIGFMARARAFFAAHAITRITRVVTDNGSCYRAATSSAPSTASASPCISGSARSHPATTGRSSATTGSCPKSFSTPGSGPQKPSEPKPSRPGTSTTTTIAPIPLPGTNPQPSGYEPASPTS